jgi:hypothetical protein
MITQGRRAFPREDGHLYLKEGEYGFNPDLGSWMVRPPGHHGGSIARHTVVEHADGTITVSPSILLTDFDGSGNQITWHGYLERGVWREI